MNIIVQIGDGNNETFFARKWKMGSCYGPKKFYDADNKLSHVQYEANKTYIDRCCLKPGTYTLMCTNEIGPFGWGNSFIEILGQRYCDDFVGYKGLRRVQITGTK